MKKTVLTFGLLSAALFIVMMVATFPLIDIIGIEETDVIGYTTMVLSAVLVFFGIRSYRENVACASSSRSMERPSPTCSTNRGWARAGGRPSVPGSSVGDGHLQLGQLRYDVFRRGERFHGPVDEGDRAFLVDIVGPAIRDPALGVENAVRRRDFLARIA
jgi:hypothetical protein